jgi:hypothetical protein
MHNTNKACGSRALDLLHGYNIKNKFISAIHIRSSMKKKAENYNFLLEMNYSHIAFLPRFFTKRKERILIIGFLK